MSYNQYAASGFPTLQKTPVSYLNEFCSRSGYKQTYEQSAKVGPDGKFSCRCTVNEKSEVGYGLSKKEAKHESALKMIHFLDPSCKFNHSTRSAGESFSQNFSTSAQGMQYRTPVVTPVIKQNLQPDTKPQENIIGKVQEYAQKNGWELPVYKIDKSDGLKGPEFICDVSLHGFTCQVSSNNKKDVKRLAAQVLWNKLQEGGGNKSNNGREGVASSSDSRLQSSAYNVYQSQHLSSAYNIPQAMGNCNLATFHNGSGSGGPKENNLSEKDLNSLLRNTESISLGGGSTVSVKHEAHGTNIPVVTPRISAELSKFYSELSFKTYNDQLLHDRLQKLLSTTSQESRVNYRTEIERIGVEYRFKVTFLPHPDKLSNGDFQCLLQLSSFPVAVCYGVGSTPDKAADFAAECALRYLYVMTQS